MFKRFLWAMAKQSRKANRSMVWNRESWNRATLTRSIDFWQRWQSPSMAKRTVLSTKDVAKTGKSHRKLWILTPTSHHTQIHLRWITDINVNAKPMKLLEENREEYFTMLDSKKALIARVKTDQLDFKNILMFAHRRRIPLTKWVDKPQMGRKYLQYIYLTRNLHLE